MDGADGVKEVIEKFTAQEETHRTLVELSRGSQSRIDALKVQRAEAKKALERARYAGGPIAMPEGEEGEEGGEGGEGGEAVAAVNGVEERERRHEAAQLQAQRERQRAQRLHRVSGKIVEVRPPSPFQHFPRPPHPPTLSHPPHRHAWPSST